MIDVHQKKGKLFVVDSGSDGSGKQTQTTLLIQRLSQEGYPVKKIDFPRYDKSSSAYVKMYLGGDFGKNAEAISPFTVSTFYAVDRFASYMEDWKEHYENGGIIIADRYTTSNMIHQTAKFENIEERIAFLDWLVDLEYTKGKLPTPDQVFFLDVPVSVTVKLMETRVSKMDQSQKKDIHEANPEYLRKSYDTASWVADLFSWSRIQCTENEQMRSIEDIHEELYQRLLPLI